MGIIKARIQNKNGEYSWADIATSSEHTHKVQQLEDNSILATKADLGLQALVDENGNPITDEQGNQKYNSLAQIFHDWLSDIKKDQPDWKETNTASPNYIQNKPTTVIETINNMPPDEEGNVKVDTLPAIGLGQDNFVLSAVRKNENTEEYQAEWKEIKVLPNFTQGDADSVLTVTNEENVPKIEWKKPNYDWNNISNKPNLINTLAEQDSINTDNLSEELIEKIENSGLEVKTGTTDPGVLTVGELGQIYVNTTSNIGFVCVKANENEYIWQAIGSTINADGEVSDALIAAHNSDPTAHADIRSSIDNSIMIDKSFGNGPDTVAEGDHTHGDLQLQIQSVEEVINADYYDNSNSVEFFTEITPSHTLWSATSSSKVTGVDIIGGRYECTTSVAEHGLKTSNLTDLVDVVKGKTIVGVANLSSDNYTLYIKMHNGTSWSFGKIKSTDKIVTVKVPDNLTQFKLGLEYGGDGSAPDTCIMTNFALYLVNDVTITSTANIPNRNYTIWSWDDEEIRNPEEFASFCNAYKINRVYQHVSTSVLDLESIRKFVGTMQKNRISVNWLTGDPLWALTEHHYHIAEQIQKVVSYNMSIQNDYEKIGTIQFDIEPHALDEWNADQASVIKQYQDAVVLMYKESLAKQLSLNVCVPFWFDSVAYDNEYGQGNLFDFVSKHSSSTVILAYNTKSYVSIAEDEIRMGALNGKNVAVGLETHEITESITEDISFANKPIEDLYRAFETLFLVYKIYGVYKGYEFVIHDYGYFKAYTDKFNLIIPPNNILDKLTTENKTDLISAINEINTEVEQLKTKYPEGGGGNCSCPTGTIEKETKIEYTMTEVPSVSCDFAEGRLYKIFDKTLSKDELLSSKWILQLPNGIVTNCTWSESDIILKTEDILIAVTSDLCIVICYKGGEIDIDCKMFDPNDDSIVTINFPEAGLYVLLDNIEHLLGAQVTANYTIIEEVNFVQSNWNQNDQTQPDYIKNKPFYDNTKVDEIITNHKVTEIPNLITLSSDMVALFANNFDEAHIVWDDATYKCKPEIIEDAGVTVLFFGNTPLVSGGEDNGIPFVIGVAQEGEDFMMSIISIKDADPESINHTISFSLVTEDVVQIDPKFIPSIKWNKIIDKPFGSIPAGETIYSATAHCVHINEEQIGWFLLGETVNLRIGDTYIVETNGVSEEIICTLETIGEDQYPTLSGNNITIFSLQKTADIVIIVPVEGDYTFSIAPKESTILQISKAYLPDDIGGTPAIDTTADEGKFLRVVGGVAAWSTVPNAEEASF